MERRLLSMVLHDRDAFDKARVFFDDGDLSEQGNLIYKTIEEYYDADDQAVSVDPGWLKDHIAREQPKFADQFIMIIDGLRPVSPPNVIKELVAAKLDVVSTRLATALVNKDDTVDDLMAEYTTLQLHDGTSSATSDTFNGTNISDLLSHTVAENRIQIMPHALNCRLGGGAWRGAHIFIYARPNMGKTLFSINMAAGFMKQGLKVLYCGNEDATVAMVPRFASNVISMPMIDLPKNPVEVESRLIDGRFDLLHWRHFNPGSIKEIDLAIQETQPDVVIVDQLINLEAGKMEGVAAMDYLAKHLRRLYIKHDVLGISIGQAGDSAAGKAMLTMEDVYGSKTAIQAATDLMIGLGADEVLKGLGNIMVSITKNKLSPTHEAFQVRTDIPINKVRSL